MAHPAEQTDQSPHRDRREPSRNSKTVSNGSFVNSLLGICVRGFRNQKGLPVGEHVHLNRLDRFRFPVHHAPNSFGCVAAEHRFAAMEADRRGNLLNPYRLTLDIKDLAH